MDMMELGQRIATLMGGKYTANKDKHSGDNHVVIRNLVPGSDPAFGISLWHDEHKKKIVISGEYPTASDGREFPSYSNKPASLQVTETKRAELIARDITDKFLPAYWEVFQKAVADRHEHEQYLLKRSGLAAHFAKILHGYPTNEGDRIDGGPGINDKHDKRGYVRDFSINASDETVNMELSRVPADVAEKLLAAWLDGWRPECRNCHKFLDERDICRNPLCRMYGHSGTE